MSRKCWARRGRANARSRPVPPVQQLPLGTLTKSSSRGAADAIIAGGAEAAVTPISMAGFSNMKAMSTRNDDPEHASRPFDAGRDGFILGEGSGILILEELAVRPGARSARTSTRRLIGYGMSNDAYDMVHPAHRRSGAGAARAMAASPGERRYRTVQALSAISTRTAPARPAGDALEVQAIKTVFGTHARSAWRCLPPSP